MQVLRATLHAMLEAPDGLRDFRLALTYIIRVGDTDPADLEAFIDELGPDAKEAFMTTAERLEARGEARGELNGASAMLIEVLTQKFGPLPEHVTDIVRSGSAEQLHAWAGTVLTADTLEEIF